MFPYGFYVEQPIRQDAEDTASKEVQVVRLANQYFRGSDDLMMSERRVRNVLE